MSELALAPEQDLKNLLGLSEHHEKGLVDPTEIQTRVTALQNALLEMPQANIRTFHSFVPGFYERTIVVPPWTVLTGAEHKTDYLVRLEKGTIAVNIDDEVRILTAPCEFMAKAGVQRAGRVFDEEVVWVDIYPNPDDCRDIDELERRYYNLKTAPLMDDVTTKTRAAAQADYQLFLAQINLTQEQMDSIVQIDTDLMNMPKEYQVSVKPSKIHGNGVFADKAYSGGEIVCPARIDGKRTPAGRYVNHSVYANVMPEKQGDDIYFVAMRGIFDGEEILVDYRASTRVNFGLSFQGELLCQQP